MKKVLTTATLILLSFVSSSRALEPGLLGEYFEMGSPVREFPDLEPGQKPTLKRIDGAIAFEKGASFPGTPLATDLYVRWSGKIRITTPGTYTFFVESDDGSRLFIYDRKVVSAEGSHPMTEFSGKVELGAGDHNLRIEYFQGVGPLGCKLSWESESILKQLIPASALFHEDVVAPPTKSEPGPGLVGEYFNMGSKMRQFPAFEQYQEPTLARVDPLIAFPDADSFSLPMTNTFFYVRWTGQINIAKPGPYTFFLTSDDGSRLFLDGKQFIDHGGQHRDTEKEGKIELSAGLHDLKLEYFQNEGYAACSLWWEGPDWKKDIIPKTAFSH